MGFFTKLNATIAYNRKEEEQLFLQVHNELENGITNQGLWMKAVASCNGDELLAKSKYVKLRVQSIRDEKNIEKAIWEESVAIAEKLKMAEEKASQDIKINERQKVINDLEKLGYSVKKNSTHWVVKEPLGGRVKISTFAELKEYLSCRKK